MIRLYNRLVDQFVSIENHFEGSYLCKRVQLTKNEDLLVILETTIETQTYFSLEACLQWARSRNS